MRKIFFTIILFSIFTLSVFPQKSESILYQEVISSYNSGFFPGCVNKAAELEQNFPESIFLPTTLLKKGECYVRMNQGGEAVKTLEKTLTQFYAGEVDYAICFFWKARAHYLLEEYDEAIECMGKFFSALSLANGNEFYDDAIFYSGKIYFAKRDFKNSIKFFEYVISNGKNFYLNEYYEALQKLFISYNSIEKFESTILLFEKITEEKNNSAKNFNEDVYKALSSYAAEAKTALGNLEDAILLYEDNKELISDFYIRLGIKEFGAGNFLEAEKYFSLSEENFVDKNHILINLYRAKIFLNDGENNLSQISKEQKEKAAKALKLLEEIYDEAKESEIKNFPEDYFSTLIKANIILENYEKVKKIYNEKNSPSEIDKYYLAYSFYNEKNFLEAENILKEFWDKENKSDFLNQINLYGATLLQNEKFNEACEVYKFMENKKISGIKTDYAYSLYKSKKFLEAYTYSLNDFSENGIFICASSALALGNFNDAKNKFMELLQKKNLPENLEGDAIFYKGFVERKLGEYKASLNSFLELQKKFPQNKFIFQSYRYGAENALYLNDFKTAENLAETLLKICVTENEKQNTILFLAQIYADEKQFGKAINLYEPYINLQNEFGMNCLYALAEIYSKMNEQEKAAQTYQKIFEKFPKSSLAEESLFRVGEIFFVSKNFSEAEKNLEKYSAEFPSGKFAELNLFYTFESLKSLGEKNKFILCGKKFLQNYPSGNFTYAVLKELLLEFYNSNRFEDALEISEKIRLNFWGECKNSEEEKIILAIEKINLGTDAKVAKAEMDYETSGKSATVIGRKNGTALAKIYFENDSTKEKGFLLAKELLELQKKNLNQEFESAAENAFILAQYFYDKNEKSLAVENYLLAAEYFRMNGNDDKAASCLYTATECFVHLGKIGDAKETAKLLKQLYSGSRYASSVDRLVR